MTEDFGNETALVKIGKSIIKSNALHDIIKTKQSTKIGCVYISWAILYNIHVSGRVEYTVVLCWTTKYYIRVNCMSHKHFVINNAFLTTSIPYCIYDICFGHHLLSSGHDDVIKWKHFPRYWPYDIIVMYNYIRTQIKNANNVSDCL